MAEASTPMPNMRHVSKTSCSQRRSKRLIVHLIDDQRRVRQAGQHLLGLAVSNPDMAHLALLPCADQRGQRLLDGCAVYREHLRGAGLRNRCRAGAGWCAGPPHRRGPRRGYYRGERSAPGRRGPQAYPTLVMTLTSPAPAAECLPQQLLGAPEAVARCSIETVDTYGHRLPDGGDGVGLTDRPERAAEGGGSRSQSPRPLARSGRHGDTPSAPGPSGPCAREFPPLIVPYPPGFADCPGPVARYTQTERGPGATGRDHQQGTCCVENRLIRHPGRANDSLRAVPRQGPPLPAAGTSSADRSPAGTVWERG